MTFCMQPKAEEPDPRETTLPELVGVDSGSREPERVGNYRLPSPLVIHEALRTDGEELLGRDWTSWAWSGLAGGLSMGLGVMTAAAIHASIPQATWSMLVVPLGTGVGFLVIVLGRQGVITESAMITALDVLSRPSASGLRRFAAVIGVVSAGNVLGAFMFAALLTWAGVLDGHQRGALGILATRTLEPTIVVLFLRSVLGGWAIALAVWTAPAAGSAKVVIIFVLAHVTGVLHLSHLAIGSIEVLHLVLGGQAGWSQYVGKFLPAVLLGNALGGFALTAVLNHLQIRAQRQRTLARGESHRPPTLRHSG